MGRGSYIKQGGYPMRAWADGSQMHQGRWPAEPPVCGELMGVAKLVRRKLGSWLRRLPPVGHCHSILRQRSLTAIAAGVKLSNEAPSALKRVVRSADGCNSAFVG